MSFGKELCNLSDEAVKNSALLRDAEEVWEALKETLKDFAKKTGERGCNIFFQNIHDVIISQLEKLAAKDEIEFMNWNSPSDDGHPGKHFEQIGVITWDSSWYYSKYPFKVSRFSILVVLNDNGIQTKILDSGENATISEKKLEEAGISVVVIDSKGKIEYATDMNMGEEYCDSCEHLILLPDPDPYDWFRDDDQKAVCTKLNVKMYGSLEYNELTNILKPLYCPKLGRQLTEEEKKKAEELLESRR